MGTQTSTSHDEYSTHDLGVGAWLLAHGQPLLNIRSEGRRAVFVFPRTAQPLAQRYFEANGDGALIRRFHLCLRDLRGLAREAVK